MFLECWKDGGWQVVACIGFVTGCVFLTRCNRPQEWRLRGGESVYRLHPVKGYVVGP